MLIGRTLRNNGFGMKIKFDKNTMPDELYNALLRHFVNEAVGLGIEVNKFTQFENWVIECTINCKESVH
jgi:hypothetical protein